MVGEPSSRAMDSHCGRIAENACSNISIKCGILDASQTPDSPIRQRKMSAAYSAEPLIVVRTTGNVGVLGRRKRPLAFHAICASHNLTGRCDGGSGNPVQVSVTTNFFRTQATRFDNSERLS